MFCKLKSEDIDGGINLIDLGSSAGLSAYWNPLKRLLNLYAFDPNEEECKRMAQEKTCFLLAKYIPYAIAGKNGKYTLYKTNDTHCWSLLEPNSDWLSRFSFYRKFVVEEKVPIEVKKLEDITQLKNINFDTIKLDTQGLELPILESSEKIVKECFLIEAETGFFENYKNESTFGQISEFMRKNDYLLFDINTDHRISRENHFSEKTKKQQILWCQSTWLKDYVAIEKKNQLNINRAKALKALILCANHGCIDFGYELATLFFKKYLITEEEYKLLKEERNWVLSGKKIDFFKKILNLIPNRLSRKLGETLVEVSKKPNPIKKLFK